MSSDDFEFIRGRPADYDEVLAFLCKYFLYEETMNVALRFTKEEFVPFVVDLVTGCLDSGYTVLAREKKTGQLAGVVLNNIWRREAGHGTESSKRLSNPTPSQVIEIFLDAFSHAFWQLVPPNVEAVLHREILSVGSPWQRRGLGSRLIDEGFTRDELREKGITGFASKTSSLANQQLMAKKGYEELMSIPFSSVTGTDGRPLVVPQDASLSFVVFFVFMTCSTHIQIWVWRCRNGDRGRVYAVLALLFLLFFTIYEVQYKTGIEIIPFLPIDQGGFDLYSADLLTEVEVSPAAKEQPKKGGLFCWVMTTSVFHKTRLPAVNETWISKCDASHFLTDSHRFLNNNTPYHTVFRRLPSSYFQLFWKTRLALFYIYRNISSEFDWYYKADDDTYAVVENLREFLTGYDPDKPYYFGFRLRRRAPVHGYNAGGSGYILSRAAMKIFAEELFDDRQSCPFHEWEDYAIARCLWSRGIYAQDTRDKQKRQRFLPWRPEQHFQGDLTKSFVFDPVDYRGSSIFHENLVAMHHLSAEEIPASPMRLALLSVLLPFISTRGVSKQKPFQASRALDSPIYDPVPCVPPPFLKRLPLETKKKIENIWRDYKEGDCWVEMARTRNLLLQLPLELRGNHGPKECKAPEILRALPHRAQRRIMEIWKERDPKGDCREQQKKTRLILLNLPASLKLLLHPPAFDCAPPHFIDRLEWDLQVKLRRLWDDYKEGQPCAERIDAQLNLLEQNSISLQSFQMPPLSMFHRLELIRKLKRASLA